MKYLIIGSSGFLGGVFISRIMNSKSTLMFQEFDLPNDICKINSTIFDEYNFDICVHFAAIANLNDSIADQDKNFKVNIRGTYEVAKFCAKNNIPLVFISTCCVYGDSIDEIEFEESTVPKTREPYACSKMAGEYILHGMPDLQYCILRIGTVYGEGMRKELFNYIVFNKIINDEIIKVNGDGTQERSYIFIDDLIEGIYLACQNFHNIKGETINLCGSESISVNKTIQIASEITGKSYMAEYDNERYGDFQKEEISIEKAGKLLHWQPKIKYIDGMKRVYEWLKH